MSTNIKQLRKRAEKLAEEKHFGQKDLNGVDYINHVRYVAEMSENVAKTIGLSEELSDKCYIVGMLHDILEDTDVTVKDIENDGYGSDIVFSLRQVTRKDEESYGDYIKRAATNQISRIVKYTDLMHNLDVTRFDKLTEEDFSRINKYLKWFKFLQEKLI